MALVTVLPETPYRSAICRAGVSSGMKERRGDDTSVPTHDIDRTKEPAVEHVGKPRRRAASVEIAGPYERAGMKKVLARQWYGPAGRVPRYPITSIREQAINLSPTAHPPGSTDGSISLFAYSTTSKRSQTLSWPMSSR